MSDNIQIYTVRSESNPKLTHTVRHFDLTDKWICSCPAYVFSKVGTDCKHIQRVKLKINKTKHG